LNNITRSKTFK